MGVDGELTRQLQVSVRDAVGRRQKVTFTRFVQIEVKADKTDARIVAVTEHRLYILTAKQPKVEQNIHLLDISLLNLRSSGKLVLGWQNKQCILCRPVGSDTDSTSDRGAVTQLTQHIISTLANLFPGVSPSKLISTLEVPEHVKTRGMRLNTAESGATVRGGGAVVAEKPCGNFSAAYHCMCEYHGVPFMEDVAWDIDTIYLSHGSRELCLSDFDHLEGRNLMPVISALAHNTYFTKLNATNVKLVGETLNEILNIIKTNCTLESLVLSNLNLRGDFIQKLSATVTSNPASALNRFDLSGNPIEDKGIQHLLSLITSLPAGGMVHLNLSRVSIGGKSVNRIAESLAANNNIQYSLKFLDLSENLLKTDDLTHLQNLLAQPNSLKELKLANCECPLENLFGALMRGCTHNLEILDLSGNLFSAKRSNRDATVPQAWKQFFASSAALRRVNFSNNKLPLEAVKSILLGIGSNVTLMDVELDLSNNALGSNTSYCQMLEVCLPNISNISNLNLSDNGFEGALCGILSKLGSNRGIKKLAIGRNFVNIKPKHIPRVMNEVVTMIQDEESPIECLLLDDLHLKSDAIILINALGSNNTLKEIDLTGNQMGDAGARMLAKALQINKKLSVIHWDNNLTSPNGFHDVACALEKNYSLRKMPVPLNDASAALKLNADKTHAALKKIDELLQRNQMPRKFSGDQAYRLQQGFLMSSIQQALDRSLVRVETSVSKFESLTNKGAVLTPQTLEAIARAKTLISESNTACQLLLHLQKVAESAEREGGAIDSRVSRLAEELKQTFDGQMKVNVDNMLKCVQTMCPSLVAEHNKEKGVPLISSDMLRSGSTQMTLPQTFISALVVEQLGTDLVNKMAELNLSAAARLSDKVTDAVLESLEKSALTLDVLLKNYQTSGDVSSINQMTDHTSRDRDQSQPISDEQGVARTESISAADEETDQPEAMPEVMDKNATLRHRRRRPQSSIESIMQQHQQHESERRSSEEFLYTKNSQDEDTADESLSESSSAAAAAAAAVIDSSAAGSAAAEHKQNGSAPPAPLHKKPAAPRVSPQGRKPLSIPAGGADLPVLSSEAPRLEHLGAGRPRRPRTHAATRPAVSVGDDLIGGGLEEDVNQWGRENGGEMNGSRLVEGGVDATPPSQSNPPQGSGGGKKGRSLLSPKLDSKQLTAGFKSLFGGKKTGSTSSSSASPPQMPNKTPQEVSAKSSTLPVSLGTQEPPSTGPSRGLVAAHDSTAVLVATRRLPAYTSEGGTGAEDSGQEAPKKGPLPRLPPPAKRPESQAPPPPSGESVQKRQAPDVPLAFDRSQPLRKSSDELRKPSSALSSTSNQSQEFSPFERNTPLRKTSDMVFIARNVNRPVKPSSATGSSERISEEREGFKSGGGVPQRPAPPHAKPERRSLDEVSSAERKEDGDKAVEEPKAKPRPPAMKFGTPANIPNSSVGDVSTDKSKPVLKPRPPPPLAPKPAPSANKNRHSTASVTSVDSPMELGSSLKSLERTSSSDLVDSSDDATGQRSSSSERGLDGNSNVKHRPTESGNQSAEGKPGESSSEDQSQRSTAESSEPKQSEPSDVVYV